MERRENVYYFTIDLFKPSGTTKLNFVVLLKVI